MRFQLPSTLLALGLLTTATVAQDAGVSSIVSEIDSIKSDLYGLSTATGTALAQATSLGAVLGSFIASVTTDSDWPAASSILVSQAATDSAKLSSLRSSESAAASSVSSAVSSAESSASGAESSAISSASAAQAGATSSGLAPMVTAGISGMMAMGVLGAAVLL